jgi:hypothetical protein
MNTSLSELADDGPGAPPATAHPLATLAKRRRVLDPARLASTAEHAARAAAPGRIGQYASVLRLGHALLVRLVCRALRRALALPVAVPVVVQFIVDHAARRHERLLIQGPRGGPYRLHHAT